MDSIGKLSKICAEIMLLTEEDLRTIQVFAERQRDFSHPLKMARQSTLNAIGQNNLQILDNIKQLRILIPKGKVKNGKIAIPLPTNK